MKCMNCGLPLSPARTLANCPRCGAPLSAPQGAPQPQPQQPFEQQPQQPFEQPGWGGAVPQNNLWGQGNTPVSGSYSSPFLPQNQGAPNVNRIDGPGSGNGSFAPRRSFSPTTISKMNPRLLFIVAGLFVFLAAILLGLVYVLGASHGGGSAPATASTGSNSHSVVQATATQAGSTPTASSSTPDASASPTDTGTAYPGQQYIDGAQMAAGVDQQTLQATNPTTTFKVNAPMYVVFNLHPPSQGGAVCSYWYLGGTQVTAFASSVKASSHGSYTYATYGGTGQGYVELYWASSKSCSGQVLAQHIDFTVTA